MAKRVSKLVSKIDINMTPMIDVVFQLLTFFMLTLKTVIVEGDFNIRMPLGASAGAAETDPIPPIIVTMGATPEGRLSAVKIGQQVVVGKDLLDELASADQMLDNAMAAARQGNRELMGAARRAKQKASEMLVEALQARIVETIGSDLSKAELTELELDCDPGLKYDHVVSAITAASGIVKGDEVVPLIKKIKFSPPKKAK